MVCQFCNKREATIHFTNVVGNTVEKIHICPQCADEKGFDYLKKSNFAMGNLISGLFESAAEAAESKRKKNRCPNCSRSYSDFKKIGRLGCSQCYDHFQDQLIPLLRSVHGNTQHLGKFPRRFGKQIRHRRRIVELQDDLARAVELEDFERAAQLRDEIKHLQGSDGM